MIGETNVTDKIKYLVITINDSKNCFKVQKERIMEKARKMANMTYSVIAKSSSKLLSGETYWKSVALFSTLYEINIMALTNPDIRKLQRIENGVFRQILEAPGYVQGEAMRGEIGALSMKAMIKEGQWIFMRYAMEGRNDLLRRIAEAMMENKKIKWVKNLTKEFKNIRLQNDSIRSMKYEGIREIMKERYTREWKQGMSEKSRLRIYRK